MGYVKTETGAGLYIRNGEKQVSFGTEKISPATFVEVVNNGGGETLLSSLTNQVYYQVSMVTPEKICALRYLGDDYGSLRLGTITDTGITLGTEVEVYLPSSYECGFYVMSGGTKIVFFVIGDSGYSEYDLYSISGTTLTLRTTDALDAIDFVGPDYYGCFKISDTQLISWSTGYSAGYKTNLYVLTVSGNTLTRSSVFSLWNKGEESYKCVSLKGCIISAGRVALLAYEYGGTPYTNVRMYLLSINGNNLGLISSQTVFSNATRGLLSDMIQASEGKATIITNDGSFNGPVFLGMVTLSGDSIKYVELSTGKEYHGAALNVSPNNYGYEIATNYPEVYLLCGYGNFEMLIFNITESAPYFVASVTALLENNVITYTNGNAQFANGLPVVAIAADTSTSVTGFYYLTAGVIKNIGRFEVKEARDKIDGVSITSLSPDKAGKIWMLKGV